MMSNQRIEDETDLIKFVSVSESYVVIACGAQIDIPVTITGLISNQDERLIVIMNKLFPESLTSSCKHYSIVYCSPL